MCKITNSGFFKLKWRQKLSNNTVNSYLWIHSEVLAELNWVQYYIDQSSSITTWHYYYNEVALCYTLSTQGLINYHRKCWVCTTRLARCGWWRFNFTDCQMPVFWDYILYLLNCMTNRISHTCMHTLIHIKVLPSSVSPSQLVSNWNSYRLATSFRLIYTSYISIYTHTWQVSNYNNSWSITAPCTNNVQ